jgi:hypothetical protein
VGQSKLANYGEAFLDVIRNHRGSGVSVFGGYESVSL